MSRQKVHTATKADWTFFNDMLAVEAVYSAARRIAYQYDLDLEDCEQDALLWSSVRPELVNGHAEAGRYSQLSQDVYTNMSQVRATASRNAPVIYSYEEEFEE